jgi:hypothetical protein
MTRTPQEGGMMNGGPFNGRIMAYGGPVMPAINEKGKRVGSYLWDEDHWEYDPDGNGETMHLYEVGDEPYDRDGYTTGSDGW